MTGTGVSVWQFISGSLALYIKNEMAEGFARILTHHHLLLEGSMVDGAIVGGVYNTMSVMTFHGEWSKGRGGLVRGGGVCRCGSNAFSEICRFGMRVLVKDGTVQFRPNIKHFFPSCHEKAG